jgi:alcohol dehydrogenase
MEFLKQNQVANLVDTVPIIAVPTTSGTGSEVTPFASVWSLELSKKFSISGTDLLPINVILDPRLTDSLPKNVTLSSGMDTISHALESLWNRNRTEESSRYAIRSLELSLKSLPKLMEDLSDSESRDKMLLSSFLGGLAIAQTRTALAHSISYPLTAKHGVPHGIACSFALPQILAFNAEKEPNYFNDLAMKFNFKNAEDFARSIQQLLEFCKIQEELLKNLAGKQDIINLIGEMLDPTRAGNNIREAKTEDIGKIIEKAAEMLRLP